MNKNDIQQNNQHKREKAYMDQFIPNWESIRDELNGLIYESSQWTY